jgi:hypothetical protein
MNMNVIIATSGNTLFRLKTHPELRRNDRLQRSCYLSRVDHDRKIWSRDIGKYSFVNRSIQLWNPLPADALGTLSCKSSNFRKGLGK